MPNALHEQKEVAIVYLSWLPYGLSYLQRFVDSYHQYNPGFHHKFIVIFNGTNLVSNKEEFITFVHQAIPTATILEMEEGQDIDAYFFAVKNINQDIVLFLNSYSCFNSENWLQKFLNAFKDDIGLLGATASNQSLYSTIFQSRKFCLHNNDSTFRKFKMYLKAIIYWRFLIPPFPNPHVRTNAFMVRRLDFLELEKAVMKRKFQAYLFESGRRSLTKQIMKKGYKVAVIGRDGQTYLPGRWKDSRTFWIGSQENVLITDNQTELFERSDHQYKKYLSFVAWGVK